MRTFAIILAVASLQSLVGSQSIDPNTIPRPIRDTWCRNQKSACPLLCSQLPGNSAATRMNDCDPATLAHSCVCRNGQTINGTEYSETIPYYVCSEANNQCVTRCAGNSACQSSCRENNPCGASDPTRVNSSTISTTMSASGTSSGAAGRSTGTGTATASGSIFSGFGGSTPTSTAAGGNSNAGAVAFDMRRTYGLGLVAAGIFAGFAFVL
ncbi:MAG: endoplasmic oxidoreductin-1 [Watsoniomyces obsoletus]|nr:MAG: endoplasmic oxidoreductin-1 [Watsoniomyces obsoletus]